ncbi:MAG TPA: phosphotransferase family protein [Conexibacter sp.]|nr:phosphotransferase family protein [Conexibacter sp.]
MSRAAAGDDEVATHAEAAGCARPPLLVLEPLRAWLDARGLGGGALRATPIGEGHSNVTYLIERDGMELVLRRPPRPPLPPSAHDMVREARLLRALAPTAARVPAVLAVCAEPDVIGAPFYVMERVHGAVLTTTLPAALDVPAQRRRVGEELIDALVELHAVDWRAAGLEWLGHPTGYLERQVRRFLGLWDVNRTRELPEVARVGEWLAQHLPASGPATIVHGDYRLGNAIFDARAPARLRALLDWELATIGDPLADVGYLVATWSEADDADAGPLELSPVTRGAGFPCRAELVARYEERSGRAVRELRWYTALALWKAAVFMEGNYKRALAGAVDDPFVRDFGDGVVELARRAEALSLGSARRP